MAGGKSLQDMINEVGQGGTLALDSGTYEVKETLILDKDITIVAEDGVPREVRETNNESTNLARLGLKRQKIWPKTSIALFSHPLGSARISDLVVCFFHGKPSKDPKTWLACVIEKSACRQLIESNDRVYESACC
jgi:hypothetical protein